MTCLRPPLSMAFLAVLQVYPSAALQAAQPEPARNEAKARAVTAEPSGEAARQEARRRFDRGLKLYNEGDNMGALAEFQRAYELTQHPVVLYNIALVHAHLGQAVRALEALEKLLKQGFSGLGTERAARARQVHQEVSQRVGTLEVETNVERAIIQIDNLDVAETPAPPLRVTAGTRLVSVLAPGHEPRRIPVTIAGQARERLEVELLPLEGRLAHLQVTSNVPDVVVKAKGQLIGKTPFATEIAFKPGSYDFTFERPGYVPVQRRVTLYEGSSGEVHVPMTASDAGLAAGGTLSLDLTEDNAVVSIDGQPRTGHELGLRLPVGRHHLRIERAGFFDVEQDLMIHPGNNEVDVSLLPTADYLGDYVSRTEAQRTWSYISMGVGGLLAAGGGGFLIWNQGEKNEAERRFDEYEAEVENSAGGCDEECARIIDLRLEDLQEARGRDVYGWLGVGIGGAIIGTGVLLYLLGDDPGHYDPKPESDVFGSLGLELGFNHASVSGAF